MGQYHYIINLTKKEYLHPHYFDDGLKLLEFGASGNGTMLALAVLLSNSLNRGGGDLYSDATDWYGRWAGDRIVIAGDYAEPGDPAEHKRGSNLYNKAKVGRYRNISLEIIAVIREAKYGIRYRKE